MRAGRYNIPTVMASVPINLPSYLSASAISIKRYACSSVNSAFSASTKFCTALSSPKPLLAISIKPTTSAFMATSADTILVRCRTISSSVSAPRLLFDGLASPLTASLKKFNTLKLATRISPMSATVGASVRSFTRIKSPAVMVLVAKIRYEL